MLGLQLLQLLLLFSLSSTAQANYKPDWESIDSRPVPAWFDDSKFGIFSHWGVYSVPAYNSEWFWWQWKGEKNANCQKFVDSHFPNGTTYADFAKLFTAEDLDANNFAEIVKASGARYFVLTSKHHEGFTLWPSVTSWNWNAVDVGPHRDLVQELATGIRAQGLHFGLYFSQYDWFHPLYLRDKKDGTRQFPEVVSYPQMLEIVNQYHPEVIWSDGDWEQFDVYWKSKEFLAWLYNDSPVKNTVVVNDRWGAGTAGKHGGFMTYSDHYDPGHLLPRKWENCLTLDRSSWGYRRNMKVADIRTVKELITQLARTISCGGNMLLNIGPDHTGRIVPIFEERLRQFGQWVGVNQEAIYGTKPWVNQTDGPDIWYTSKMLNATALDPQRLYNPQKMHNTVIYAFLLNISPDKVSLTSIRITDKTRVTILGTAIKVPYKKGASSLLVDLGGVQWQALPSTEAIVLKVEYAATSHAKPLIREMVRASDNNNNRSPSASFSSSSSEKEEENRIAVVGSAAGRTGMEENGGVEMLDLVAAADERD